MIILCTFLLTFRTSVLFHIEEDFRYVAVWSHVGWLQWLSVIKLVETINVSSHYQDPLQGNSRDAL